jgi:hypothetical protein
MRGRVSQYRVHLNRKPRQRLEALVRRRAPEHYMVMRAKIVLASASGLSMPAAEKKSSAYRGRR